MSEGSELWSVVGPVVGERRGEEEKMSEREFNSSGGVVGEGEGSSEVGGVLNGIVGGGAYHFFKKNLYIAWIRGVA